MARDIPSPTASQAPKRPSYQLSVNLFDRTATLLIALLVIVGMAVSGMMIVFFAGKFVTVIEPIAVVPVEATSANANQGIATEPDPPGFEEAPDLIEPQLQDTLDALTQQSNLNQALFSDEAIDVETEAGKGQGLGDGRLAGPGGEGVVERVERWKRWKIRFEPESTGDFSRWLDAYKIRVGVLGRDNQVHVAYDFTAGSTTVEAADPAVYRTWGQTIPTDGPMPALTQQLARKANITRFGTIVLLFYPFEVESLLWTLENKYSEGRDVNTIRETVFTVVREQNHYRFEVIDQKYFY